MPDMFRDCLAPGGVEQLRREAEDHCRRVITSRARKRPSTLPDSSAAGEVPDHLTSFVNPHIDTAVLNVEGGELIAELVEVWSRLQRHQELPPLSPRKALTLSLSAMDQQQDSNGLVVVDEEQLKSRAPLQRPSQSSPFLPLSTEASKRLLSYGDSSQDPLPRLDSEARPPTRPLVPTSTPLLPSPAIATLHPPSRSPEPNRKQLKVISNTVEAVESVLTAPDPSPLVPQSTNATTHVDPTPSSAVFIPASTIAPAPASSHDRNFARSLVRPSRETRAARHRVLQILYRKLGGMRGPDNTIVPFAEGDPRLGGRSLLKRRRTTPEHESFKTISASVTASGGSRDGAAPFQVTRGA